MCILRAVYDFGLPTLDLAARSHITGIPSYNPLTRTSWCMLLPCSFVVVNLKMPWNFFNWTSAGCKQHLLEAVLLSPCGHQTSWVISNTPSSRLHGLKHPIWSWIWWLLCVRVGREPEEQYQDSGWQIAPTSIYYDCRYHRIPVWCAISQSSDTKQC